jgi:hypothetical protein
LEAPSSFFFQLQLEGGSDPLISGYNPRESPTPKFFGYSQKEDTTPYVLWLQPKGGYYLLIGLVVIDVKNQTSI